MRSAQRGIAAGIALGVSFTYVRDARAVDRDTCFNSAEAGQELRKAGHLRDARARFVVCAQQGCPSTVQSDCTNWVGEVDAAMPTVVVQAHDAQGNDLPDVRVLVDGVTVATHLVGKPIAVDPGQHTLRVERPGMQPIERTLLAVQGQKERVLDIEMDADASPSKPAAERGPVPLATWVLGGIGAAALVTTGVFWIWGRSNYSSLAGSCAHSCNPSDVGGVRAKLIVGDVALGVGVVSLGLATYFYLTRKAPSAPPSEGAQLFVTPSIGGAVAGLGGSF